MPPDPVVPSAQPGLLTGLIVGFLSARKAIAEGHTEIAPDHRSILDASLSILTAWLLVDAVEPIMADIATETERRIAWLADMRVTLRSSPDVRRPVADLIAIASEILGPYLRTATGPAESSAADILARCLEEAALNIAAVPDSALAETASELARVLAQKTDLWREARPDLPKLTFRV